MKEGEGMDGERRVADSAWESGQVRRGVRPLPQAFADHDLLSEAIAGAPIILWAVDMKGRIVLSEGRGLAALGLAPGEVVGESVYDLYSDVPEVEAHVRRAMSGQSFSATVNVRDKTFDSRYAPIRDADGRQTGVIGVSTDITERVRAVRELARSREETIRRLTRAVEERSHETGGHIERMAQYSAMLARRLGLSRERCELIRLAAPMHDVGKIAIPDQILLKPSRLAATERMVMERHTAVGHAILHGSDAELLELAAEIAWTHHEHFDGHGYPRGLAAEEIPLEGRIAAIGDVFDALTHDRVYRPAMTRDEALAIMREGRGTHFDPDVLDEFFAALDEVDEIQQRFGLPPRS